MIEYFEGAVSTMKAFGEWTTRMRVDMDRPIKIGNDRVTCLEFAKQAMVSLGAFHGHHWMDETFRDENDWIWRRDWHLGEN